MDEFEALKYLKENKRKHWLDDDKSDECLNIIEQKLLDFQSLQDGIKWRKESYKKEISTGLDGDGDEISETNMLILMNLYNIMIALQSYYDRDAAGHFADVKE